MHVEAGGLDHIHDQENDQDKVSRGRKFLQSASKVGGRVLEKGKSIVKGQLPKDIRARAKVDPTNTFGMGFIHLVVGSGMVIGGGAALVMISTGEPISGSLIVAGGLALAAGGVAVAAKGVYMMKRSRAQAWTELKTYKKDKAEIKDQKEILKFFADKAIAQAKKELATDETKSQLKDFKKEMRKIASRRMWSKEDLQQARHDINALLEKVKKGESTGEGDLADLSRELNEMIQTKLREVEGKFRRENLNPKVPDENVES